MAILKVGEIYKDFSGLEVDVQAESGQGISRAVE